MSPISPLMRSLGDTAGGWWRDLRIAALFLTRLPVPGAARGGLDVPLAQAARAFPMVGAGVGAVAGAVLLGASWLGLHPLACGLAALGATVILTGALHEDGLGDIADGFGGGATPAEKLAIMRDSRIGTYGVLAIVFSVVGRAALLAGMLGSDTAAGALVAAGAASRGVLPALMHWLEPARDDGAAHAAGRPSRADALTAAALGGLLALLFLEPAMGIAAVLAAGLAALAGAAFARAQVGGHSGDVLGAVQQVTEIAVLVAVAGAGL